MENARRGMALLLALALACGGAPAQEAVNPRVEMESAADVLAALGFAVEAPEGAEASYAVIGGATGEATFSAGGLACTLRASRTQDDISGLFMEMSEPTEQERALGEEAMTVAHRATDENGGYDVYTWFVDDVQYCLVLHGEADAAVAEQTLQGVIEACAG